MMRTTLILAAVAAFVAVPSGAATGMPLDLPLAAASEQTLVVDDVASDLPYVGIGTQASASCSPTSAHGEAFATGPLSYASTSASVGSAGGGSSESGLLEASSLSKAVGGPASSSASASASNSLGLFGAYARCWYTHGGHSQDALAVILGLVGIESPSDDSSAFSVGCVADRLVPVDGAYDGTLQVSGDGGLVFVGTWTDGLGTRAVAVPAGGGVLFTPSMAGTIPADGLRDTGLRIVGAFTATLDGVACEAGFL